jgi:integrase
MAKMLELHPDLVRLVPHDLRHTAASLAISAGANVKAVQKMLGHASAAMTLDVYADLFDDDLDAVGDALSAVGAPEVVGKMWARSEIESETVIPMKKKS